ncbi:LuxR family transcriptional regulator [Streptomyces sp. NPDC052192]|uniref:helix-turn-helix transcriptional regulator n=1 Tax=Streptomyces sp. NPDC052192 TaxID=3155052 RepID=UPI00343472E1
MAVSGSTPLSGGRVHALLWPAADVRLRAAREALEHHQGIVVTGAWGSGRSTLLAQLGRTVERDTLVVRAHPRPGDEGRPLSGLAQMLAALPQNTAEVLPREQRTLLRQIVGEEAPSLDVLAVRLALASLVTASGASPGWLLMVDDAQWLDGTSAEVLRHVVGSVPPDRLRVVVAVRTVTNTALGHRVTGEHVPTIALEPLTLEETVAHLESRGVRAAAGVALHHLSGGHPLLVRALAEDAAEGRPVTGGRYSDVAGTRVREAASAWLATVDDDVRGTLARVALAHEPTRLQVRRTWGSSSDAHMASAVQEGILGLLPGDRVVFTAEALRYEAGDGTSERLTGAAHRALAATSPDPVHAARHRLLGQDRPGDDVLTGADEAAALARAGGDCALSADILLAAAERTPNDRRASRVRRLTEAARDAGAAGRADLARRAADALATARAGRAQVVALLAAVDASGQELTEMDELLPRARRLAGADMGLLAAVDLRSAIRHNLGGRPEEARRAARRAAREASAAHEPQIAVAALTMQARMERITAHPAAQRTLRRALGAEQSATALALRDTPRYLACRHALFDDRLDQAETALMTLLPLAEVSGSADDLQEVLRSLAELDVRRGACVRAARWSERALAIGRGAGLSLGPAWYTCALTAAAGSSFEDAARFARMGALVSREAGDLVFTSRNLWALGTVELVTGRPAQAAALLGQVAELERLQRVRDVTMLRWQPELVEALTLSGRHTEAERVLESLRRGADGTALGAGWGAGLDRSEAVHLARTDRRHDAIDLLDRATSRFAELGLRLEQGRTQLTRGRVERARRRGAAARRAVDEAAALFEEAGARPWLDLALTFRRATDGGDLSRRGPATLTATERKVVEVVVAGASNKEAAERLFLSVKTVEAVLSRVYRKLDVRSRNQLAAALRTP